ncbi:hypothetical protein O6H91_22G064700 [Diphasiastrum complanatum]|uniref:Uncharacterized protein n=1 Tax=Diphasiastrum complanatum TaxID=34168 RepID=A0ACC2AGP9_DIPCM|nr:hypothetical protein O6H91_22G064700 [Diphasiastrum complanatum]
MLDCIDIKYVWSFMHDMHAFGAYRRGESNFLLFDIHLFPSLYRLFLVFHLMDRSCTTYVDYRYYVSQFVQFVYLKLIGMRTPKYRFNARRLNETATCKYLN